MTGCRKRLSWNPEWRCHRRALLGYCAEHWLERSRWEHRWGRLRVELDLGNLNRLSVMRDRYDRWWAVSFGNDGADPAFSIAWNDAPDTEARPTPPTAVASPSDA